MLEGGGAVTVWTSEVDKDVSELSGTLETGGAAGGADGVLTDGGGGVEMGVTLCAGDVVVGGRLSGTDVAVGAVLSGVDVDVAGVDNVVPNEEAIGVGSGVREVEVNGLKVAGDVDTTDEVELASWKFEFTPPGGPW